MEASCLFRDVRYLLTACGRAGTTAGRADALLDLHHLRGRLSGEHLRNQPERDVTGYARTEGLTLLLELLDLVGYDLNQLLELLELARHPLQQLLQVHEQLLLKELHLLELLRHGLQQLCDLRQRPRRHRGDSRRPDAVAAGGERI
jgi:hypothetical protein